MVQSKNDHAKKLAIVNVEVRKQCAEMRYSPLYWDQGIPFSVQQAVADKILQLILPESSGCFKWKQVFGKTLVLAHNPLENAPMM